MEHEELNQKGRGKTCLERVLTDSMLSGIRVRYESYSSMCDILCYYTHRVKEINHCDPAFRSLSHCGPVLEKDTIVFFWIFTGKPATMGRVICSNFAQNTLRHSMSERRMRCVN